MRIGIDASRAVTRQRTGTEAYATFLIQALISQAVARGHEICLYFNAAPPAGLFPAANRVRHYVLPFPRLWTHLRLGAHLRQDRPDVFFTPAHVIPLGYRGPSVATVHDLGYHFFPQAYTRRQLAYLKWSTRHNARQSRAVIADSQATKTDLVRLYGTHPAKISVVYPGRDPALERVQDQEKLAAVQHKLGLKSPYLLYLGTLQPRKNLVRLLRAYVDSGLPHQLVLAGKIGWQAQEILNTVQVIGAGQVRLPGYVAEEDKAALLSGASVLLFPSLYEGFGFPVLEAMACGTPVLCADNSSLPEVAGEAALLVPATDEAALAQGMRRIIVDEQLRARLIAAGYANITRFNWDVAAREVLAVLERTGDRGPGTGVGRWRTADGRRRMADGGARDVAGKRLPALRVLGVPVHAVTMAETLERIGRFMAEPGLHQVATVNPEFVIRAQKDPEFRYVLQDADICLADGVGILLAARRYGRPLPGRVPGSALIYPLAEQAAQAGWRLFLLGAAPGAAAEAGRILQQRFPGLILAGTYAGSPDPAENEGIVRRINDSQAEILLVAYGAPGQDVWIARNKGQLPTVRLAMGIGGTLDFITGRAVRAPEWVQRLGLEWLHRLVREPWRWWRMLALPQFALRILLSRRW